MEVVNADSSFSIVVAEAHEWSYENVSYISEKVWETDFLKMVEFGLQLIQVVGSKESS